MQDNIVLTRDEYEILLKDSIDLAMLSNDYKHLKRRNETLEEHIEYLRKDINFYILLYKNADARTSQLQKTLDDETNIDAKEMEELANA